MGIIKRENITYEYPKEETTVDSLLDELLEIVKSETAINNTWSQLYAILTREGKI